MSFVFCNINNKCDIFEYILTYVSLNTPKVIVSHELFLGFFFFPISSERKVVLEIIKMTIHIGLPFFFIHHTYRPKPSKTASVLITHIFFIFDNKNLIVQTVPITKF